MDFIKSLPKVELHAHLNGSLSNSALLKLHKLKYGPDSESALDTDFYKILGNDSLTLSECFLKFKFAHNLTDTKEALKLATECMISDFAAENTIYLEIRTTPKENDHLSRLEYLEAIIEGIQDSEKKFPKTLVKLIASINRADGVDAAWKNLEVALQLKNKYPDVVKGLDLSGDPLKYTFDDFKPIFEKARNNGLGIAIHCAESTEAIVLQDLEGILRFKPDRIGHGTFINESDTTNWQFLVDQKIPVECCLTSNVKCGTVKNYEDHHFKKLFKLGHPIAICTDDFGVFDTNLTREIGLTAVHHDLSCDDLINIMEASIDISFADPQEKDDLKKIIRESAKN